MKLIRKSVLASFAVLSGFALLLAFVGPSVLLGMANAGYVGMSTAKTLAYLAPAFAVWTASAGIHSLLCRVMFGLALDRIYTVHTILMHVVANVLRVVIESKYGLVPALISGALIELTIALVLIGHMRRAMHRRAEDQPMVGLPLEQVGGLRPSTCD
jgi:Na+/proline symporter